MRGVVEKWLRVVDKCWERFLWRGAAKKSCEELFERNLGEKFCGAVVQRLFAGRSSEKVCGDVL